MKKWRCPVCGYIYEGEEQGLDAWVVPDSPQ